MAAIIALPDGMRAMIHQREWFCPDKAAMPVLEYFTEKVNDIDETDPDRHIALAVVSMMAGARLICADRPGIHSM